MRPKTGILFVVAAGCGLFATMGVSQYLESASGGGSIETVKIFVAATDIAIAEELNAQNVKLEEWPKDRVPDGAITTLEELENRYPKARLFVGEPILMAKLMDSSARGSESTTIPKGMRVVSVKVDVDSSIDGLIRPGDRVDLMVFLRKSGEIPETGTKTILKDVNVFSVDGTTERTLDADGQARQVRTVSLLVKPNQAEKVILANNLGRLFLSLRSPNDTSDGPESGQTIANLLELGGEKPEDRSANQNSTTFIVQDENEDAKAPFLDWLGQTQAEAGRTPTLAPSATAPSLPVDVQSAPTPAHTMVILTANGRREFQWINKDDLPQEVGPPEPAGTPEASTPVATYAPPRKGAPANAPQGGPAEPSEQREELEELEELDEALSPFDRRAARFPNDAE